MIMQKKQEFAPKYRDKDKNSTKITRRNDIKKARYSVMIVEKRYLNIIFQEESA